MGSHTKWPGAVQESCPVTAAAGIMRTGKNAGNPAQVASSPAKLISLPARIWPPPQSQLWKNQASGGQWNRGQARRCGARRSCGCSVPVNPQAYPPGPPPRKPGYTLDWERRLARPRGHTWGHQRRSPGTAAGGTPGGTAQAQAVDCVHAARQAEPWGHGTRGGSCCRWEGGRGL